MVMLMKLLVSELVRLPVLRPVWSGPAVLGPGVPRSTYDATGQKPPCFTWVTGAGVVPSSAFRAASEVTSAAVAATSADVSTVLASACSAAIAAVSAGMVTLLISAIAALMSSCAAMIVSSFPSISLSLRFSSCSCTYPAPIVSRGPFGFPAPADQLPDRPGPAPRRGRGQGHIHPRDHRLPRPAVPQDELVLVGVQAVEHRHPVPLGPEQLREPLQVSAVLRRERRRPHRLGVHIPLDTLRALLHRQHRDPLRPGLPPVHLDDLLQVIAEPFGVGDLVEGEQRVGVRLPEAVGQVAA